MLFCVVSIVLCRFMLCSVSSPLRRDTKRFSHPSMGTVQYSERSLRTLFLLLSCVRLCSFSRHRPVLPTVRHHQRQRLQQRQGENQEAAGPRHSVLLQRFSRQLARLPQRSRAQQQGDSFLLQPPNVISFFLPAPLLYNAQSLSAARNTLFPLKGLFFVVASEIS